MAFSWSEGDVSVCSAKGLSRALTARQVLRLEVESRGHLRRYVGL